MAINILLGRPGGGKTYEAVANHILPAIKSGRRVITNIKLNLFAIYADFPQAHENDLVKIISDDLVEIDGSHYKPFAHESFFSDPWKNEDNVGPLYVVDECQLAMPKSGTRMELLNYFQLHRHTGSDILLITQHYGQISPLLKHLIQNSFTVSKLTALGFMSRYKKSIRDGVSGYKNDVISTSLHKYDSSVFRYYKSHTLSSGAVKEAETNDLGSIFRSWPMFVLVLAFLVLSYSLYRYFQGDMDFFEKTEQVASVSNDKLFSKQEKPVQSVLRSPRMLSATEQAPENTNVMSHDVSEVEHSIEHGHPYSELDLVISSSYKLNGEYKYIITGLDGSESVFDMDAEDLLDAGYTVESVGVCLIKVSYGDYYGYLVCKSSKNNKVGVLN